ncbi:Vacuolar protein sorting-associated protein 33A [Clonorchis sinensis]|uniref:Vacuolar protein sorting-associated protein 33A n=1 Tax=Clonorchis sinensis TaxID=79923 RepID=A0A8T1ML45_CLOSI|nr:Vacuolar protein sorting-associated protein 33A [Clonorchis sinensis]
MDVLPTGPVNLTELKNSYQNEFLRQLDMMPSPKAVYWEKRLMASVSLIVGHSVLKKHGVSHSFLLEAKEDSCSPPECKSIVFILSSNVKIVDCTQAFVTRDIRLFQGSPKEYHIIAIPSFSYACKNFLGEKAVLKKFSSIYEFPLTILPLDSDLVSMEDPSCFATYSISQRQQGIYQLVQGLLRFQSIFGLFPVIRAKGNKAVEVARMLTRMRREAEANLGSKSDKTPLTEVDCQTEMLILLDRSVDCLTPLLSQLTYEGLISEKWGIRHGACHLPTGTSKSSEQSKRLVLNASDELFAELRDQNFAFVGSILNKKSKDISALLSESKAATELTELKRVVSQLPEIRSTRVALETHLAIAEQLKKHVNSDEFMLSLSAQQDILNGFETDKAHPYIEECILRGAPLHEVLQLICIQSFCNGGLKQRLLEYYKREILQVYGFENVFTLDNLDRVGLLYDSSANSASNTLPRLPLGATPTGTTMADTKQTVTAVSNMFATTLKRSLRLLVTPTFPVDPSDPDQALAQIYSGYIPISIRLIQALSMTWIPKTVSASAGQLITAGPSNVLAMTSALLTGRGSPSSVRPDGTVSGQPLSDKAAKQTRTSSAGDGSSFIINLIPGGFFEEQQVPNMLGQFGDLSNGGGKGRTTIRGKPRVIVVAFVGGVTHAEIAALRTLSVTGDANVEFIIITMGFLNAKSFIGSLSQDIQPVPLLPL